MASQQDVDELRVFELFAAAACLPLVPGTVVKRDPPEPDILCELTDSGTTCFELVEVVDPRLARAIGLQLTHQPQLITAADTAVQSGGADLANALVYVSYDRAASAAQRNAAVPSLMATLQALPAGFVGDVPIQDASLAGLVKRLRISRGDFVGPAFQVDGATFVGDPILERLVGKFGKTYSTAHRLELLAFYELQPSVRAEYQMPAVDALVKSGLASSSFSRVWIFDVGSRTVLYHS
jgi:hypothetical protein